MSELDRQIALVTSLPGVDRRAVEALRSTTLPSSGDIPFCIALRSPPIAEVMKRITARNATGLVDMTPCEPSDFVPIETIPSDVYLLTDIDTGKSRLNITPEQSLATIRGAGRTPLTLEEGVMLAFLFPILTDKRFNAIQMPGSRRAGDQRIPSIWISKGAPRLGWCWDRNPHTWLASASAGVR